MKIVNMILASLCLLFWSKAQAQLAVVDSGRFTLGIHADKNAFKANGNMDSMMEHDLLIVGYKLAAKDRWIIGGGIGQVLNGKVHGENEQVFSNGSGQRLFLQGQYGLVKFGSTLIFGEFGAERDSFAFSQGPVKVKVDTIKVKYGLLATHRWGDFTMYEGLHLVTHYKGRAEIIIPDPSIPLPIEYTMSAASKTDVVLGFAYAVATSVALRLELSVGDGMGLLVAADFKM